MSGKPTFMDAETLERIKRIFEKYEYVPGCPTILTIAREVGVTGNIAFSVLVSAEDIEKNPQKYTRCKTYIAYKKKFDSQNLGRKHRTSPETIEKIKTAAEELGWKGVMPTQVQMRKEAKVTILVLLRAIWMIYGDAFALKQIVSEELVESIANKADEMCYNYNTPNYIDHVILRHLSKDVLQEKTTKIAKSLKTNDMRFGFMGHDAIEEIVGKVLNEYKETYVSKRA